MAILEPLKITIVDASADFPKEVTVPDYPADESRGSHQVAAAPVLYIEQSDFQEVCCFQHVVIYICFPNAF